MKRSMKRHIALTVILSLLATMMPVGAPTTKAAGYGVSNPRVSNGVSTWDCIYFGNYWQEDTDGDGTAAEDDPKQPIKWRVLSVNGNDAFLVADKSLDAQQYNEEEVDVTWETCTMRSWLNGYGSYESNNFLDNAFTESEQSAILSTTVVNEDNSEYGTEGGNNTSDKVYLLSISEVMNNAYGFSDIDDESETRISTTTGYVQTVTTDSAEGEWWLRTPGKWGDWGAIVFPIGTVHRAGTFVDDYYVAVRPALHLNLASASSWSYAGTVSSSGVVEEEATPTPGGGSSNTEEDEDNGVVTMTETAPDFVIGGNKSGSASGAITKFFPGDWKISSVDYPVDISKSTNLKDGSYTIKIAIGLGRSDLLDDTTQWKKFKNNMEKLSKSQDKLSAYAKAMKAKGKSVADTKGFKGKPKLSLMGYFEEKYDKNGNIISSTGKVAADASWEASTTWQFATPIGPIYLKLKGGGGVSGEIGPKYNHKKKEWQIVDGSLTITPKVSVEGGYGIDGLATLGASGSAKVPMQIVPFSKASINASAAIHLYVAFLIDAEYTLAKTTIPLWDTTSKKSLSKSGLTPVGKMKMIDTSFTEKTSGWNGTASQSANTGKVAKYSLSALSRNSSSTTSFLQEGILTTSLPVVMEIDGKKVMVFQELDISRDTINGTVLRYSVYEDGEWSIPRAVYDDGKADLYADMKVVDGTLALTWQKEKTALDADLQEDAEQALDEMGVNSEIYCATFDSATNTFVNPTALTDNATADMMPQISESDSNLAVTWVRNSESDFMQESGTNAVYQRVWNGTAFEAEEKLCETEQAISRYASFTSGADTEVFYVAKADEEDAKLYNRNGEVVSAMEQTEDVVADITFIRAKDDKVTYVSNGTLYEYDMTSGETATYQAGESAFGSALQYCANGDKEGYIWSTYDEDTMQGAIMASMKTGDGYSEPVTLFEGANTMYRHISPTLSVDGQWSIIANAQDVETTINSLVYLTKEEDVNLSLNHAQIDENDKNEDGLSAVDYFVTNTEDTPVDTVVIDIELEAGTKITKEVEKTILPGETVMDTAYLDLSDITESQIATLSVYAKGQSDTSENSVTGQVGASDVEVKGTIVEQGTNAIVTAKLNNKSDKAATCTLNLTENNTSLASRSGIALASDGAQTVTFTVPKSKITYNANGAAYLLLKANVTEGDYYEDNNEDYVILYKQKQTQTGQVTNNTNTANKMISSAKNKVTKPGKVKIKSAKNIKKKKVKLKWKKVSGAKGYQIQYATNKKFKKKKSKYTKKKTYTVKKLKKKKTYYFRVRAYKLNGKKKVYGKWSKVKKVKIKK